MTIEPRPERALSSAALSWDISSRRPTNRPHGTLCRAVTPEVASTCSAETLLPAVSAMRRSSVTTSDASAGRSSGAFASKRMIIVSSDRDTFGLWYEGATGTVLMCCEITATTSSPTNGACPVTISYRMQPTAYRSLRASACRPIACSGGI